jgi:hypothetical protein
MKNSALAVIVMIMLSVAPLASAQLDWEQVVGSYATTPAGFGDSNNLMVVSSAVIDRYLYAGTFNMATGSEVWRTNNGTIWLQVNSDGFGNPLNVSTYSMQRSGGHLYAGTWAAPNTPTTDTRIWQYSSGTTWNQVNTGGFYPGSNNDEPMSMAVFCTSVFVCRSEQLRHRSPDLGAQRDLVPGRRQRYW